MYKYILNCKSLTYNIEKNNFCEIEIEFEYPYKKIEKYIFINNNNNFYFNKYINNKIELYNPPYNKYRVSRVTKHIYYTILNINKLKSGNVKKYRIYNRLQLEIICNYLNLNNFLYKIEIYSKSHYYYYKKNYDDFHLDDNIYYNEYMGDELLTDVLSKYEIYIKIYKDYLNRNKKVNLYDLKTYKNYIYF